MWNRASVCGVRERVMWGVQRVRCRRGESGAVAGPGSNNFTQAAANTQRDQPKTCIHETDWATTERRLGAGLGGSGAPAISLARPACVGRSPHNGMGQSLSLPQLLGATDATAIACLDRFEADLLLYIVRMLTRDEPAAIGQLIMTCKTLAELATTKTAEGEELRKARRVMARQVLFDLRQLASQQPATHTPIITQPATLTPIITQISRQLSFRAMRPEVDEPKELDLSRWRRSERPSQSDHQRGTAVRRVLYANQTIVSIDLSVCYLTYMDATEIASGLKVNRSLTTLNASGNFFGGYGLRDQANRNSGKFVQAPEGVESIAEALGVSTLTSLILAENRLGPEGIKALAPGLARTSLTSLDLSRNGIGADGAAELAVGLCANTSLRRLDVRLNKLGPQGAKALAPGVAACSSLTVLDARFNGVTEGDEGEAALQEAVKDRWSLNLMVLNEMV